MNIDVPAGVGAPLLDTHLLNKQVPIKSVSLAKWGTCNILQWIHLKTTRPNNHKTLGMHALDLLCHAILILGKGYNTSLMSVNYSKARFRSCFFSH